MFYNANLYKVGLMNSQRHGGQRSTFVTFSTPEIPGASLLISSLHALYTNVKNLRLGMNKFTKRAKRDKLLKSLMSALPT